MQKFICFFFLFVMPMTAVAQEVDEPENDLAQALIRPAGSAELSDFLWKFRPLVVFADSPSDPRYIQQMDFIASRAEELIIRDVVVLTDTDPAAGTPLRTELRPRGFMLVLIGKDGQKYLRKPFPWDVREITRTIDKLPTRQREIRERQGDS